MWGLRKTGWMRDRTWVRSYRGSRCMRLDASILRYGHAFQQASVGCSDQREPHPTCSTGPGSVIGTRPAVLRICLGLPVPAGVARDCSSLGFVFSSGVACFTGCGSLSGICRQRVLVSGFELLHGLGKLIEP